MAESTVEPKEDSSIKAEPEPMPGLPKIPGLPERPLGKANIINSYAPELKENPSPKAEPEPYGLGSEGSFDTPKFPGRTETLPKGYLSQDRSEHLEGHQPKVSPLRTPYSDEHIKTGKEFDRIQADKSIVNLDMPLKEDKPLPAAKELLGYPVKTTGGSEDINYKPGEAPKPVK